MTDTEPKPANPDHIRRDFHRLTLDWVHLHTQLPKPLRGNHTRPPAYRDYGHPAEWASDNAARIAGILHDWHDLVAEARNERNPPPPTASEQTRVTAAWHYLEPRIEQLVQLVAAEAFTELRDIHQHIRAALGHTHRKQILPIPCPGQDCGLRTMTRRIAIGRDLITCSTCGYTVREDYYPMLVRIAIDTLSDQPAGVSLATTDVTCHSGATGRPMRKPRNPPNRAAGFRR